MWNDVFLLYTESWKSLNVFFQSIPFSPEGSEHLSLWPVLQPTTPLGNRTKQVDCWWVRSTCVGGFHIKSSHVTEWKQYRCYESLASVHRLCECSGRGLFTLLSSPLCKVSWGPFRHRVFSNTSSMWHDGSFHLDWPNCGTENMIQWILKCSPQCQWIISSEHVSQGQVGEQSMLARVR